MATDLGTIAAPIGEGGLTVQARIVERFETGTVLVRHARRQWLVHPTGEVKRIGRGHEDQEGLSLLRDMLPLRAMQIVPGSYESAMALPPVAL